MRFSVFFLLLSSIAVAIEFSPRAACAQAEKKISFNREIRPILSENCFYCHGQDANKRESDLRLDVRELAIEHGAIDPGQLESSLLIERIQSTDPAVMMPPPNSNRRLSDEQIRLLKQWVAEGAGYQEHWAFVAPQRPTEPDVKDSQWCRNPIDRFVLAKLEALDWQPAPIADRATLIKRLSADLVGLPPSPAAVAAFVADDDPAAYEKLVDELLSSPHYGERLALPWLDAARYSDSNGFQQDGDNWQWMWRDWVVKALNEDLSFDQFTTWQLAGDLLPNATTEQQIATGFNRNHLLNGEGGAIAEEQRFNGLFDRVDTTATNWLGLTMACAQCHDHKYDPTTQQDYYRLLDAFNQAPESGAPRQFSTRIRVDQPILELPTEENKLRIAEFEIQIAGAQAEWHRLVDEAFATWQGGVESNGAVVDGPALPDPLIEVLKTPAGDRTEDRQKLLVAGLRQHFDEQVRDAQFKDTAAVKKLANLKAELANYRGDQIPRPMIMSDENNRETQVLDRGEYLKPLEKVTFDVPQFLPPLAADLPRNRLGFARWLFAPENPLTARVQVNRMWQYFFGTGIVKTSEDFGLQSEYPVHPELLDWLAIEFRESGWSMKHMHRLIVTSNTYRQSSRMTEKHRQQDQENRLHARGSRLRMPSLLLRDWALDSAGLLNHRIGGRPVYPYQPDAVWEALAITKERDFTYPASSGDDLYRRSIYTFWRRTVGPTNMFDTANRQTCRVRSGITSTPLHALTTLNDPTWVEAARMIAQRSLEQSGDINAQIQLAFQHVVCRVATDREIDQMRTALDRQVEFFKQDLAAAEAFLAVGSIPRNKSLDAIQHAALTALCLAILNFDEALTRE